MTRVLLPIKIISEANNRCHWCEKSARVELHSNMGRDNPDEVSNG